MKKEYKIIQLANGEKELMTSFEDEQFTLVELLFNGELENFAEWFNENIEMVLSGTEKKLHISGNICKLEIGKTTTRIYNMLADDDECCDVDTMELFQLIKEWCKISNFIKK